MPLTMPVGGSFEGLLGVLSEEQAGGGVARGGWRVVPTSEVFACLCCTKEVVCSVLLCRP